MAKNKTREEQDTALSEKLEAMRKMEQVTHRISSQDPTPTPRKKTGRPSRKVEGVDYTRVTHRIPKSLLTKMKMALLTTHQEYGTQENLIEAAIREFLKKEGDG